MQQLVSNMIIGLKNIETNKKLSVSTDEPAYNGLNFYPTPVGLFVHIEDDCPFEDISKITKIVFHSTKYSPELGEFRIDTYTDSEITYRYRKNRNLYNKHDAPEVYIVGGFE